MELGNIFYLNVCSILTTMNSYVYLDNLLTDQEQDELFKSLSYWLMKKRPMSYLLLWIFFKYLFWCADVDNMNELKKPLGSLYASSMRILMKLLQMP